MIATFLATKLLGRMPDFLIIGAQKSGTSSLHFYLNQHPRLHGSQPKELHYFDKSVTDRPPLAWYRDHFRRSAFSRVRYFEATPNYIYHPRIPRELSQLIPRAKYIAVLRNPVERAYSAWNMYRQHFEQDAGASILRNAPRSLVYQFLFKNRREFPSFDEALAIELNIMKQGGEIEPALIRRGFYADQLSNWYQFIDPKRILVLESDDLKTSTLETINRIVEFVNVPRLIAAQLDLEPKHVRIYSSPMSEESREMLEEIYRKPNERLYEMLGRRYAW